MRHGLILWSWLQRSTSHSLLTGNVVLNSFTGHGVHGTVSTLGKAFVLWIYTTGVGKWQEMVRTMSQMVNDCPNSMPRDGGLQRLHSPNKDVVNRQEWTVMKAFTKWKRTSYVKSTLSSSALDCRRRRTIRPDCVHTSSGWITTTAVPTWQHQALQYQSDLVVQQLTFNVSGRRTKAQYVCLP